MANLPVSYTVFNRPPKSGEVRDYGVSLTRQEFKDECDIHRIMARYERGMVLPGPVREAVYGDFSSAGTYLEANLVVVKAREQFDTLPAEVRKRFRHDVKSFLEFVNNPGNIGEMRKMGLVAPEKKIEEPAPQKVIVVEQPKPKGKKGDGNA